MSNHDSLLLLCKLLCTMLWSTILTCTLLCCLQTAAVARVSAVAKSLRVKKYGQKK